MAIRRDQYLRQFLALFDPATVELRSESVDGGPSGWPARLSVRSSMDKMILVDLYIGIVHSHSRAENEYRFQGPASSNRRALQRRNGVVPILLGIDVRDPSVLVAGNAEKYLGNFSRQTVLFDVRILSEIRRRGWAEYHSSTGETIRGFLPEVLPAFVDMANLGLDVPEIEIRRTLLDSGYDATPDDATRQRVITSLARLVRDHQFSRDVVQAYNGRCAISDLNWGIVEAAHIFPVSAPGSTDHICNGIGLTPTYHSLFDRHRIYICPNDYSIRLHPTLREDRSDAAQGFLKSTRQTIRLPANQSQQPHPEMLKKRYAYFGDAYSWATT